MDMEEKRNEEEVEQEKVPEQEVEPEPEALETDHRLDKLYSNIASNRFENLRTSWIENRAKELRKKRK